MKHMIIIMSAVVYFFAARVQSSGGREINFKKSDDAGPGDKKESSIVNITVGDDMTYNKNGDSTTQNRNMDQNISDQNGSSKDSTDREFIRQNRNGNQMDNSNRHYNNNYDSSNSKSNLSEQNGTNNNDSESDRNGNDNQTKSNDNSSSQNAKDSQKNSNDNDSTDKSGMDNDKTIQEEPQIIYGVKDGNLALAVEMTDKKLAQNVHRTWNEVLDEVKVVWSHEGRQFYRSSEEEKVIEECENDIDDIEITCDGGSTIHIVNAFIGYSSQTFKKATCNRKKYRKYDNKCPGGSMSISKYVDALCEDQESCSLVKLDSSACMDPSGGQRSILVRYKCASAGDCTDQTPWLCTGKVERGHCDAENTDAKNYEYMKYNCRRSCGMCSAKTSQWAAITGQLIKITPYDTEIIIKAPREMSNIGIAMFESEKMGKRAQKYTLSWVISTKKMEVTLKLGNGCNENITFKKVACLSGSIATDTIEWALHRTSYFISLTCNNEKVGIYIIDDVVCEFWIKDLPRRFTYIKFDKEMESVAEYQSVTGEFEYEVKNSQRIRSALYSTLILKGLKESLFDSVFTCTILNIPGVQPIEKRFQLKLLEEVNWVESKAGEYLPWVTKQVYIKVDDNKITDPVYVSLNLLLTDDTSDDQYDTTKVIKFSTQKRSDDKDILIHSCSISEQYPSIECSLTNQTWGFSLERSISNQLSVKFVCYNGDIERFVVEVALAGCRIRLNELQYFTLSAKRQSTAGRSNKNSATENLDISYTFNSINECVDTENNCDELEYLCKYNKYVKRVCQKTCQLCYGFTSEVKTKDNYSCTSVSQQLGNTTYYICPDYKTTYTEVGSCQFSARCPLDNDLQQLCSCRESKRNVISTVYGAVVNNTLCVMNDKSYIYQIPEMCYSARSCLDKSSISSWLCDDDYSKKGSEMDSRRTIPPL